MARPITLTESRTTPGTGREAIRKIMKIGPLTVNEPMQNVQGRVLLAWQTKPWWTWGLWWFPFHPAFRVAGKRKIFSRIPKHWWICLGDRGFLNFGNYIDESLFNNFG